MSNGDAPIFEIALWPGEGRPVIEGARDSLPLRASPDAAAPITDTLVLRNGRGIDYDSTRYQTLRSATVTVLSPTVIEGRHLGDRRRLSVAEYYSRAFRDTLMTVRPSSRLEYLQSRAEGSCFLRIDGGIAEARTCPVLDTTRFRAQGEPLTQWWIHVRSPAARGWLVVSDSTARVTSRRF